MGNMIASTIMQGSKLQPNSRVSIPLSFNIDPVDEEVRKSLVQNVKNSQGLLRITSRGNLFTNVVFLNIQTSFSCKLEFDLLHGAKLTSQNCKYFQFSHVK